MVDFHSLFQGSLFFVSGVVGIMAIIAIVYCISWCFDKSSGDDLLTPDELEARRLAPMLVRQAGLAGILKEEQTKVIKFHFEANSFPYAKETNETEATNDKTSKNAKETNASPDEHVEETVDKPEDAVDKDIQNMEEGKNDDGDDTKEKIDDAVDTSGAEEAQEHPTVEEKEVGSTEKSEEVSVEIGSPSTVESTDEKAQPITCSTCQGGYGELLSTAWAGLGLGANEEVNSTVKSEPKEGGSVKNDSTDEETKQESDNLEQAEDGICSICLGDYENGEKVITGTSCGHMFHLSCFMEWVQKKHMDCPVCRSDMITPDEFTASSFQVLGDDRVNKIRRINEEAARRLEECLSKNQDEVQMQQQPAAAETTTVADASTTEPDIEKGEAPAASSDVAV